MILVRRSGGFSPLHRPKARALQLFVGSCIMGCSFSLGAGNGKHGATWVVGWWGSGSDWCWWILVEMGMMTVLTRIKKQPATTTTTVACSMNSVPGLFVLYVHIPTHLWTSFKETGMVMTSFKYVDVSYRRASLFAISLVCKMLGQQVKQIWFWEW